MVFILISFIFISAFLYASVGHGGASAYLAILLFFGFSTAAVKVEALWLNCMVSLIAAIRYYKNYFHFRLFWPFAISSIPMAYLGAKIQVDPHFFRIILAALLIIPCLALFGVFSVRSSKIPQMKIPTITGIISGAIIGCISGIIGIGGGIMLSPLLVLNAWTNVQTSAAIAAVFIFVNSISGLISLHQSNHLLTFDIHYSHIIAAVFGALLGAYWGASLKKETILKKVLACVLAFASVKLFLS